MIKTDLFIQIAFQSKRAISNSRDNSKILISASYDIRDQITNIWSTIQVTVCIMLIKCRRTRTIAMLEDWNTFRINSRSTLAHWSRTEWKSFSNRHKSICLMKELMRNSRRGGFIFRGVRKLWDRLRNKRIQKNRQSFYLWLLN